MGMTTVADAASLASVYADRLIVGTTRDVHGAIARRILGAIGQRRSPVGLLHDGITATVYGCVGLATRSVGKVGNLGVLGSDLEATPRGRRLRSIVNGLIGDVLADQQSPIAIETSVRHRALDVELTSAALGSCYPDATGRLVVFVHGLCEDDESWRYARVKRGPSYLERLAEESDWTPIAVRYNSGRPVVVNARDVAELLDRLVDAWPVPVEEVALVGHSMGGLLTRAAAVHASKHGWGDRVSRVVLLGSPHGGAGLEQLVDRAIPALARLPEVAPFGSILDERSLGIRDLRHGIGADTIRWPRASYHCVGASLGSHENAFSGRFLGDLLVGVDSARGDAIGLDADFLHVPGAHHFDLLNHPAIYADLARWLDPEPTSYRF